MKRKRNAKRFEFYFAAGRTWTKLSNARAAARRAGGGPIVAHRAGDDIRKLTFVETVQGKNPMAKKKRKKKSTAKRASNRSKPKSKKKSSKKRASNPGKKLKSFMSTLKPGKLYDAKLRGANVTMRRKGGSLIIRPRTRRRAA